MVTDGGERVALFAGLVVLVPLIVWLTAPKPGPFRKGVQEAIVDFGQFIATLVGGLVALLVGVAGCLVSLVLALAGLFFIVWIIKRMWEAA